MNTKPYRIRELHLSIRAIPRAARLTACLVLFSLAVLPGCTDSTPESIDPGLAAEDDTFERGPNNGRMLRDDDFAIELAVHEAGVPPEFRAWATRNGQAVDPRDVELQVQLTRLGDRVDEHDFTAADGYLRGSALVYEPHSFAVDVSASYDGRTHRWAYDSFEGRTQISPEMADSFGLQTSLAGPAIIEETVTVYGHVVTDPDRVREVSARFEGAIQAVHARPGDTVAEGQVLATVESNESLLSYPINAPISGVIAERSANAGEQTAGRRLFTIVDTSSVWAELSIFPGNREQIGIGMNVTVTPATGGAPLQGTISYMDVFSAPDQSVGARVVLANADGSLAPGTFVSANVRVGSHQVPLAVRRSALQSFRDFTVVYAQIGDTYEVRMLDLGRAAGDWVEVLGGLEPGTRYVTENSYVLKADIEKAGAAHDH